MGLFSGHRRLPGSTRFQLPVRLHSESTLRERLKRGAGAIRAWAVAASNDARVVGTILVVASAALAVEMAASFK